MPSHYTHLVYGEKVIRALPEPLRKDILRCLDCVRAGFQGPDPLFYYGPLHKNPIRTIGTEIHKESGAVFFGEAMEILRRESTPEKRSYIAGCICHYMLDTTCHPFIDKTLAAEGIGHLEVETEVDSTLLLRSGRSFYDKSITDHLNPSRSLAEAAAPFYPGVSTEDMDRAFRSMKRYIPFTRLKNPALRGAAERVLLLAGMTPADLGMLVRPSLLPRLTGAVERLLVRMEDSIAPTAAEITAFFDAVENGGALSERFRPTFDGEEEKTI